MQMILKQMPHFPSAFQQPLSEHPFLTINHFLILLLLGVCWLLPKSIADVAAYVADVS